MKTRTAVLIAAMTFFAVNQNAVAQEKPSCAVIGFINDVKHSEWQDARVGMGVRAMLTQSLHETALFSFLDEKEEIKATLEAIAQKAWMDTKGGSIIEEGSAVMKKEGARFIASGKVYYFGKPRTTASVGPAHFSSDEVEVKIEVTLIDATNGKSIVAVGSGKAITTAQSALFTFHNENLEAGQSMVGTATGKAIDAAVAEIVKKYRQKYKDL